MDHEAGQTLIADGVVEDTGGPPLIAETLDLSGCLEHLIAAIRDLGVGRHAGHRGQEPRGVATDAGTYSSG